MSDVNYVIREDGIPEMITAESDFDFIDAEEILDDYPYIVESMNEEGYCIEDDLCYVFDELVYENKVVGFATFDLDDMSVLLLTDCYILPEFRGNMIFFNEISKMIFSAPQFGILQPTRKIVELLMDYSFAKKVTDDVVVSGIDFYFDDGDYLKSSKNREIFDEIPVSNFYDLGILSTIYVNDDEVIYHDLLEKDLKEHGERKALDEDYFADTIDLFSKNRDEFENLILELKDEMPQEKLGYDIIIGDGEGLSEFMQGMVDNELVSYNKALEIRQQLITEFESGEISDDDIDDRLTSILMEEIPKTVMFENFDEFLDSMEDDGEDTQITKKFFDLIKDNEELGAEVFDALISDDKDKFEDLIANAMDSDEEFSNNFLSLVDDHDDNLYLSGDEFLDMNPFGLNLESPYPVAEMMWGPNDDKYKLDDTFYGKDYPISYDHYMFRVLNALKKYGSLKVALVSVEMKGAATSQAVESQMFMMGLISDEVNYDNWDEFANDSLTINDLKRILRENNLKISGKKQELIDRVAENQIPLDKFKSEKVTITPDGYEFLKESQWIAFYDAFLYDFDFNDFVKYMDNNDGEFIELTLKYLDQHLKLAKKENDKIYMADCTVAKEQIAENGEDFFKN